MNTDYLWAIPTEYQGRLEEETNRGRSLSAEVVAAGGSLAEMVAKAKPSIRQDVQGLAVLRVHGALRLSAGFQRAIEVLMGQPITATYDELRQEIRAAAADPNVKAIVLDVSSPGGAVFGCSELADEIYAARARGARVVAYANNLTASAGYWIASQAQEIYANEAAQVGSVGVFALVYDESKAAEMAGVRVVPIRSALGKAANAPGLEVTEESVRGMQDVVNATGELFVRAVARGRGISYEAASKFHDGEMYIAGKAQELGMIDHVMPIEAMMRRELAKAAGRRGAATRAALAGA